MAEAATHTPAKESFAALLDESLGTDDSLEGKVLRGTIVSIEGDSALVDVGLKSEGRVALKEFAEAGQMPELKVGDVQGRPLLAAADAHWLSRVRALQHHISDRLTAAPGDTIRFMVSCDAPDYESRLVRLIHGDTNPAGTDVVREEGK